MSKREIETIVRVAVDLELSEIDWQFIIKLHGLRPNESACKLLSDIMREGLRIYRGIIRERFVAEEIDVPAYFREANAT